MRIIAIPQDALALESCLEVARAADHEFCLPVTVTYNRWTWDLLTGHESDVIFGALKHFGVNAYQHAECADLVAR